MRTAGQLTSVFNIPQIEDEEEVDYRKLYEKEKKLRIFYERKTKQLEGKLRTLVKDNRIPFGRSKAQDIQEILQDIKSFKSMLPNSVKEISLLNSDQSIDSKTVPPLLNEWAIYGLNEVLLAQLPENSLNHASTIACNSSPSQILEHSSKLVFPSGTSVRRQIGKTALQSSLDIINLSKEKLKSFILTFEPASLENRRHPEVSESGSAKVQIIDILNPQRRVFAVCIELQQFTIPGTNYTEFQVKSPRKIIKSVKFKQARSDKSTQDLSIVISKRVYCIFTYYPFFGFFQELLKGLLYAVKVERYIRYKEGGQNLSCVDSRSHCILMKSALQQLRKEALSKSIVAGKLLDFSVCGSNKAYLQLTNQALLYSLAEEWAYYILDLFTLDVFLDVLTLMMLQEKIVFVCKNATILTHAVFLFTKVLIKPFQYPYPVVNIIPDQEQYLNAPFPIVYGYLKSKSQLLNAKIPKRFKNVYVFFEPGSVEIVSQEDKRKILNRKSPRLRDRLISKFKKMQKNYPSTSFFSFMQRKNQEFEYPVNIDLSRQIIGEVYSYIDKDIYRLLPSDSQVEAIKKDIESKGIGEEDINQQTYLRIKQEYSNRSKDPFFAAFLETQLFNVHIFRY